MGSTYTAVEVSAPNVFRVVERAISKPAAGQVRIRVQACGVCHSDLATILPKDRRQTEGLVQLYHEMEVGYARLV